MVYADARSGGYLSACALYRGSVASGTRITSGSQPCNLPVVMEQ